MLLAPTKHGIVFVLEGHAEHLATADLSSSLLHDLEPLVEQLLILNPGQLTRQCTQSGHSSICHICLPVLVDLQSSHPITIKTSLLHLEWNSLAHAAST